MAIFGYRNHNTTSSSIYRLLGTNHVDCGNALTASNSQQQPQSQQQQYGGINNPTATGATTVPNRPSNHYTSRSVSFNTTGSYLAVAGSASTVRLLNVV